MCCGQYFVATASWSSARYAERCGGPREPEANAAGWYWDGRQAQTHACEGGGPVGRCECQCGRACRGVWPCGCLSTQQSTDANVEPAFEDHACNSGGGYHCGELGSRSHARRGGCTSPEHDFGCTQLRGRLELYHDCRPLWLWIPRRRRHMPCHMRRVWCDNIHGHN